MADQREVFFYGLYMDPEVLRGQGIDAGPPRRAHVDGFALRIGERATLVPCAGGRAHGVVYALDADALRVLYGTAGMAGYQPEGVRAWLADGSSPHALCYLWREPTAQERNDQYARQLKALLARLEFPPEAVAAVAVE